MRRALRVMAVLGLFSCGICWAAGEKKAEAEPGTGVLPQGETGIASKYMMDEGIDRDGRVVFSDDFEGGRGGWDGPWANGGRARVVGDPGTFHGGRQGAEVTITRQNLGKEDSCGFKKTLNVGEDILFMRYYVKYEKNTEVFHGGAHNGAGLDALARGTPDASPGIKADGRNKFTVLMDTYRDKKSTPSPGPLAVYVYHPEQRHQWGEQWFPSGRLQPFGGNAQQQFGSDFVAREEIIPPRDKWLCYELMVKANTPGKRDGRIAFWVEGKLAADFPNLRLRDVAELKLNKIWLMVCSKNPDTTRPATLYYDDIVVARTYVGPMNTGKKTEEKKKEGGTGSSTGGGSGIVPPPGWGTTPGKRGD